MLRKRTAHQLFYFKLLKFIFFKMYVLFRTTRYILSPYFFYKKLYIHTGSFSRCFFVFPRHIGYHIGSFKMTRKLYNSSIVLRKKKR